jgi:hypothetical protein
MLAHDHHSTTPIITASFFFFSTFFFFSELFSSPSEGKPVTEAGDSLEAVWFVRKSQSEKKKREGKNSSNESVLRAMPAV